jgi:ABC-type uncharacterized transport system permease subunit
VTEFLLWLLSLAFVGRVLVTTIPFALAAMGGSLSERSGVVNIALEGMMLMGAFGAAAGAYDSGNVLAVAIAYGVAAGVGTAALYALVVVTLKANQIVAGVAINILAYAITPYMLKIFYNSASNSPGYESMGGVFSNPVFWLIVLLVAAVHVIVTRTRWGLRVRAVGDHPEAAHTLGVSVDGIRWQAVLASGALAGLGGVWLSMSTGSFIAGMSGGRGYMALAAVIMGSWRPLWGVAACLLFGVAETIKDELQSYAIGVPNELVQTLPYLLTIIATAGFIGRSRVPAALGKPYESG